MSQQFNIARMLQLRRGGSGGNTAAPVVLVDAWNRSGGALARGDTVISDWTNGTADLLAITTSTAGNDRNVLGMAYEAIAASAVGKVQVWGPTDALKADGTTDIAKGDMLSSFTTAKIAQKTTGAGAFARAMEAYSANDSSGVIDAFIFRGFGVVPGA